MSPSYPLFFQSGDGLWLQPIPVYLSAIFGASAPLVIGAIDVVLIYFAAAALLKNQWTSAAAALVLLLFPAHAAFSHQQVDAIYPVPFVIAWLVCVLSFLERPRPWLLFVGGLSLGLGVYTQPSAPITMAALMMVGLGALWLQGHRSPKTLGMAITGFGTPLLLMVPWFAAHPETYQDTMGRWAMHQAHIRFPLDGVRAFINWNTLVTRTSLYWEIFNPSFLMFPGDAGVLNGRAPILVGAAVLASIGGKRLLTANRASLAFLLLAGLAVSPLAASTFGERHALHLALPVVAFVSLLAALGAAELLESRTPAARVAGAVLLAAIPLQYFLT